MCKFTFLDFSPGKVTLGWRFDDTLPSDAKRAIEEYFDGCSYFATCFSPERTIAIEPFALATEPIPWTDLIDNSHFIEEAKTLGEVCTRINSELRTKGLRLPTEDEFEAAIGGGLFAWGDFVPNGIPSRDRTEFTKHNQFTTAGLRLNHDTYYVELVEGFFKLGDGGVSLCGGDPWPIAWLCLSPCFRVPPEMYSMCLREYLESTLLRPVKISGETS